MDKKLRLVVILIGVIVLSGSSVLAKESSYSRGVGVEIVEDFEPINPLPEEGIVEVEKEEEKQEKDSKREEGSSIVISNRLPWTGKELEWMIVIVLFVTAIVSYKLNKKKKIKYKGARNNV